MDTGRCVALHNYLVLYAWVAQGYPPAALHASSTTFFTAHGAAAEALRPRIHPSLAAFLDSAMLPPGSRPEPLFFLADHICNPNELFANATADLQDMPDDSLVNLYDHGQGGEFGGGLFYLQGSHRAAVFMHMDSHDYAFPIDEHPELWHPLETVLSNWIELIFLGKVVAEHPDAPRRFDAERFGPWDWRPYGDAQVDKCVAAWDRLCEAIEARVSTADNTGNTNNDDNDNSTSTTSSAPLVPPAALDAASVPDPGFARAFLTSARRPCFSRIAPGLVLPPTDTAAFAALQPFTDLPRSSAHAIPPVCLFPAAPEERERHLVELTRTTNPFFVEDFCSEIPMRVGAGVYSEAVERSDFDDHSEEGFRLLLPFRFRDDGQGAGARRSDGSPVGSEPGNDAGDLFQHGYKPFGGDSHRPQRLERLFDCWRGLVDDGVWAVGMDGVQGTLDTFGEAGSERCRHYYIPPSW